MVIKATRFTPELMLSAPKRGAGLPNSNGSQILYGVTAYSFSQHKGSSQIRVFDVETNESSPVTDLEGASEPKWLGDDHVIFLAPGESGATRVIVGSADNFDNDKYVAGTIDGGANGFKIKKLQNHSYLFAISAMAKPDGTLFNPEKESTPNSSGRLYSSLFVRHWDTWITSQRQTIFYGALSKSPSNDKWELSELTNALKGTGLESPIPTFGGTDHWDISPSGLIFVAKDPKLNPATNTKSNVYLQLQDGFDGTQSLPKPSQVSINGYEGASSSPVFSADGKKIAFLQMTKNGYESDRNEIFAIPDVSRPGFINHLMGFPELKRMWDVSPTSIQWSVDGRKLFVQAEVEGHNCLWLMSADYLHLSSVPAKIFSTGSVVDVSLIKSGEIFVTASSLVDNSIYYRLVPRSASSYSVHLISSNSMGGAAFGLSPQQIDEIWFEGAEQQVHAWVIKPSYFQKGQKYPLAYMIHGGPQGAWTDAWNNRWNPAVFAQQGYVVITPNPTGSTGYGQRFCDAIQNQWGGLPYEDIVKGFEHIEENVRYVDTSNSVILGASYGGYMMNWVQGQPLGRKFKAIVCHDGVFSMAGQMASDELYFLEREFGGKFWNHSGAWLKWDPARFTHNWATPQLVIHSEKDYRLTVSEGLAAFNVLQDRGVESQFLTFPDENHWILQPENSLLWHTAVLNFINKHAGLPLYSDQSKTARKLLEDAAVTEPTATDEE